MELNRNIGIENMCGTRLVTLQLLTSHSQHLNSGKGRVPLAHIPIAHIHSHRPVLRVFPLEFFHQSENFILN